MKEYFVTIRSLKALKEREIVSSCEVGLPGGVWRERKVHDVLYQPQSSLEEVERPNALRC